MADTSGTGSRPRQSYNTSYQPMDINEILQDCLRCLEEYWIQLGLVFVIVAALAFAVLNARYSPVFRARITYAVSKTGNIDADTYVASRVSASIPVIANIPEFRQDMQDRMGTASASGGYSLTSQYEEIENLFTVTATAQDYKTANAALAAFESIFPGWAEQANGTLRMDVIDRYESGQTPSNPYSPWRMLAYGLLGGAAACAGLMFLYSYFNKTIRKESDMKRITDRICFSLIPQVDVKKRDKSTKNQLLLTNQRLDWTFTQSLLTAQTRIENQMAKNGAKVLLVTSTLPQEGKSMIAANLALAFARNHKKTVLLDGDFRNPTVAREFGLDHESQGLTDFFAGEAGVAQILQQKGDLALITSGTHRGGLSPLIKEDRMDRLTEALADRFDYVVLDSPPAHLFSDAAILAKYAQAVVYVVRSDMASENEIREGMSAFAAEDKLIGYIINRTAGNLSTYGRYGYYGKYGRYGSYGKYKHYIHLEEQEMNSEDSL